MINNTRGLWRGKQKTNGEWIIGDLRHIADLDGSYYPCIVDNSDGRNNSVSGVSVDPSTLGECTGLRDKNGKLIFEGDISKERYTVVYDKERVGFGVYLGKLFYSLYIFELSWFEVIGNIHDNPELLKGDTNGQD